ncbi:MAG: methyltransferase domain-containing protein [Hyphomicrobiales bacterium]|nr:methyltransferase domain-containing protein [Hyphomicrobiales bacterium]MBV9973985.1 methyltransferase domain-containing protein [Hyphomicrobiales bacterium]
MPQNDAAFIGSIPQLYDEHMGALLFAPYARDMAKRLSDMKSGELLETAAGTGIVTEALATGLAPSVRITATDLNQPMLDHAAKRPGVARVRFKQADAQALPFSEDSFDAVICQFGVMFFPDKVQGFREARRVLKPGGRFVFSVWDRIETIPVIEASVAALRRRHPKHPSWFMERVPCGYHDETRIRADLKAAGFADCTMETLALEGEAPDARGPALGMCQGSPLGAEIETVEPGGSENATKAVISAIKERFGEGAFKSPLQALVVETRK